MSGLIGPSRREFLKASTVSAGGTMLFGGLSLARSAHAAGSDVLKVALIGCGGRGTGAAGDCLNADPAVRIIAVADAFEDRAKGSLQRLKTQFGERIDVPPDRVFVGLDSYKQAIAAGPDLVILTSPPGFRPLHYAAAIEAGKHVFMEKPVCVDAAGFRSVMQSNKLADQKGLKVVVGLQRRHDRSYIEAVSAIQDGKIGELLFLRAYWNGSGIWVRKRQPGMTEMQYQVYNWYHFCWLSGDNITEQHVHNLDVCNWIKNAHPVEANGMGGCQVRYTGENKGVGHIYDHHFVEFTYADGTKMFSQCRHIPNCWNYVGEAAHGTKGVWENTKGFLEPGGTKKQVAAVTIAERRAAGRQAGKRQAERKQGVSSMVQEHMDLIAAIRKNEKRNEGYYGATSSMTAVLGRMAVYSGQVVKWDEAVEKGPSLMPKQLAWDAEPPVKPDAEGNYPIPIPGVYKPF